MLLRGLFAGISHKITSTLEGIFYRCQKKGEFHVWCRWGLLVVSHPWLVILFSLLLCGALSGGLLFWDQETDQELLWTPYGSPVGFIFAKKTVLFGFLDIRSLFPQFIEQKEWIAKTFPRDRRFENLIAVGENVLTADTIRYVSGFMSQINSSLQFFVELSLKVFCEPNDINSF